MNLLKWPCLWGHQIRGVGLGLVLVLIWLCHYYYLQILSERDKHFSHLSSLERELSFRSEMAMYYSYYKDIIESRDLGAAVRQVVSDNLTQYPDVINPIQRFNIYPELLAAACYRITMFVHESLNIPIVQCWQVDRGELPAVTSCEGLGEPAYFYISFVFFINGLLPVVIFLFGYFLGNFSFFGGMVATAAFFFNHRECTRVMWTPPLRESFAFPFILLQNLLVECCLRRRKFSWPLCCGLIFCNVILLSFWQFSQFAFLTQLIALSFLYGARFFDAQNFSSLLCVLTSHIFSFGLAAILLLGNRLLLTSLYFAALINFFFLLAGHYHTEQLHFVVAFLFRCSLMVAGTFSVRHMLTTFAGVQDDSHILDLLKTKLTLFRSFHTQLYVCAPEFDFIGFNFLYSVSSSLLLPIVLVLSLRFLLSEKLKHAYFAYHFLQLSAYAVMAVFIMRLKLFLTPFLCITASLIALSQTSEVSSLTGNKAATAKNGNKKTTTKTRTVLRVVLVALIFGAMCYQGMKNVNEELANWGEFSNWPLESLIRWIRSNTSPDDAFGGAMPTTAAIRLSANRPIANHPHYEDVGMRNRTFEVYTIYSRKPLAEIHQIIKNLAIRYVVVEDIWCESHRRGCALAELYDIVDAANRYKDPACFDMLQGNAEPYFKRVFRLEPYALLEVNRSL